MRGREKGNGLKGGRGGGAREGREWERKEGETTPLRRHPLRRTMLRQEDQCRCSEGVLKSVGVPGRKSSIIPTDSNLNPTKLPKFQAHTHLVRVRGSIRARFSVTLVRSCASD